MKYFTQTIPPTLAEKLKEKGMPMITSVSISIVEDKPVVDENGGQWYRPSYAEVLDWLLEKGLEIYIVNYSKIGNKEGLFRANIVQENLDYVTWSEFGNTWHKATNAAIEKALTLI